MQKTRQTRFLALLLAVVMVIGLTPINAFATEIEEPQENPAAFVEETEAENEVAEETEAIENTGSSQEIEQATEAATETATEEDDEETTMETTQPEKEYDFPNVDSMTDAELLAYYAELSDEEAEAFALSLTEEQLQRLADLLYAVELCGESSDTHTVFKNTQSTLAPGVTQNIKYAYATDGKQMVYYIATADVTRDDVVVQSSYYKQHEDGVMGMAKLTEQIEYANAKYTNKDDALYISDYYNVVAGVNSSFYNMTTGQPMGITFIDGVSFGTGDYDNFFAILKDGKTAVIDYASNLGNYVDENSESTIWQAAAGSQWLVRDGQDVTAGISGDYNTARHSRTCVGVTNDGKVVLMVLDGRQEPFSCGGSMHELAQIMLEAGCVAAINLDGGGSTTFVSKAEGANAVSVINRPSDGSERSISAGIIIASTTVPSNVFDHVAMVAADEYVTPGTSTDITVSGVSPAGTTAEIPADVTYTVTNGTYENGVLTAASVGDVVLTAKYKGETVGTVTIHSVIPTAIEFNQETRTISYGKTVEFDIAATVDNGLHPVKCKDGDIVLSVSDSALGTINGLAFTANAETSSVASGIITAKLAADESVSDTIGITLTDLPDAPVIWEDFETAKDYKYSSKWAEYLNIQYVDSSTGKVHGGNYSLAITMLQEEFGLNNYSGHIQIGAPTDVYSGGTVPEQGTETFENLDLTNAKKIGLWVYIPEDSQTTYVQLRLRNKDNYDDQLQYRLYDYGYSTTELGHRGWRYFEMKFDEVNTDTIEYNNGNYYLERIDFYTCTRSDDYNKTTYGYDIYNQQSIKGKVTFYIDDLTVEYVDTGADFADPVFDYVRASYGGASDSVDLNGQTITTNVISVTARASDAGVGINPKSAKAYIDGVALTSGFRCDELGIMTIEDVTLADGTHTFTFVISDNNGNCEYVTRQVTVNANSNIPTASLELAEELTSRPLFGQIVWFNLNVDDIENIETLSTILNLNATSYWELDHMVVANGFEASYTIDTTTNDATITVKKVGATSLSGKNTLVQIPVRMHYLSKLPGSTSLQPEDIKLSMDMGLVSYNDGTSSTFSMTKIDIDSERYSWYDVMNKNGDIVAGYVAHIHNAKAIDDKAATCTENGYANRTYCEVCHSEVAWGTTIPATGHTYEITDGVLKCHCGETFTGTWTDGKKYTNGIAQTDGWVGDSYYVDGVKLTGIQMVDGYYYDFGEDGACVGKTKYTGFLEKDDGWYYITIGTEAKGWQYIDGDYYYFDPDTGLSWYGKTYYVYDQTYLFNEKGMVLNGIWHYDGVGTLYYYGPSAYKRAWVEIDGNTYYFDEEGHRKEGISWFYLGQSNNPPTWYEFTDEGVYVRTFDETGLWEYDGKLYYLAEGVNQKGLFLVDGDYYYFNSTDFTAVSGRYYVNTTNGLDIVPGYYNFDESTHKMVIETDDKSDIKNGLVEENGALYYYVDGVLTYAGLIQVDGDYYYINSSCKAVTGTYWVFKTNGLLPEGSYEFGTDGKMIIASDGGDEVKNGLVEENGALYYYVDGVLTYAGLIQVDGDYYYINSSCKAVTGTYWVFKTNGLLPEGSYEFGTDGKMIIASDGGDEVKNGLVEENGALYYYVDGVLTYAGLIQVDGDYYYINSSCKAVTGTYWVFKTNDLLPAGSYEFGADGKMIIASGDGDEVKNGLVEENGGLYYYVDGVLTYAGLIQVDGDYYYINSSCKAVTGTYWVFKTNDLLPAGNYTFGTDGKMIAE